MSADILARIAAIEKRDKSFYFDDDAADLEWLYATVRELVKENERLQKERTPDDSE